MCLLSTSRMVATISMIHSLTMDPTGIPRAASYPSVVWGSLASSRAKMVGSWLYCTPVMVFTRVRIMVTYFLKTCTRSTALRREPSQSNTVHLAHVVNAPSDHQKHTRHAASHAGHDGLSMLSCMHKSSWLCTYHKHSWVEVEFLQIILWSQNLRTGHNPCTLGTLHMWLQTGSRKSMILSSCYMLACTKTGAPGLFCKAVEEEFGIAAQMLPAVWYCI